MSYDLYFWRQTTSSELTADALCARLGHDEEPAGIESIPVDKVKARFMAEFPGMEDGGTELYWEGASGSFQVAWPVGSKPRHTLALFSSCSYRLLRSIETMNRIIDVAHEFGCALYDPQAGKRYEQPEPIGSM